MNSLWTDRSDRNDHDWLAQQITQPRRRPDLPPPPPPPRRSRLKTALIAGVAAAVVGAGVLVGTQLGGDEKAKTESASALPASSGRPGETRVNEIYARVSEGVVNIRVTEGSGQATGTGFVIDSDGTIVTNAHVVGNSSTAQVTFDDGDDPVSGTVVGKDPSSDLAVIHVDPADAGSLHPLTFANSDDVHVGDTALAIGYPLGLDKTATAGIVSGLGRKIEAPNGFSIDKVIQTDAPINPGNSGGPLIDSRGRVIGVNSQIATASAGGGNVGIGFAVPSNTVRKVVPTLKGGRSVSRPYLGVSTSTSTEGDGAVVRQVTAGGPAEKAGIRPSSSPDGAGGDIIIAIDGKTVSGPDDVANEIARRKVGDEVRVTVKRDGTESTVTVRLQRRPDSTP